MKQKSFEPGDLWQAGAWLAQRAGYKILPLALLLKWSCWKGRRRALTAPESALVRRNLQTVFGDARTEEEITGMVQRHFEYAEKFNLILRLPYRKVFARAASWPIEGLHHLAAARAQGRGAIVISAHFGYARLIEYILSLHGYQLRVVRSRAHNFDAPEKNGRRLEGLTAFGRFMYQRLRVRKMTVLNRELFAEFNVRPLVQALQKNNLLYLLGDGTRAMKFVKLGFLGRTLPFPTGFFSVALATGAPVVPAFAVECAEGHGVKVVIEAPLQLDENAAADEGAMVHNVEQFARLFESYVERYPHLYKMISKPNRFERRLARSGDDVAARYIPGARR